MHNRVKRKFTGKTEYRSVPASEANIGKSFESFVKMFHGDQADLNNVEKVLRGLMQYNSMRTMMMNMTSATQNIYMGFSNIIQEAVGRSTAIVSIKMLEEFEEDYL
jgi:hypothetical protein